MANKNHNIQVVWGIALVLMGIMVFFRIPQIIPEIEQIETFSSSIGFIRFCFYFMAAMLTAGGGQKLYRGFKTASHDSESADE